jgi:hypothetical protein
MQEGTRERSGALRSLLASSEVGEKSRPRKGRAYRLFKNSGSRRWCVEARGGALFALRGAPAHPGLCIASCAPYLKGWGAQRALTRIPCGFGIWPARQVAEL